MPYIHQISIVSFISKSIISGVVLDDSKKPKKNKTKYLGNIKTVFYSYLIPALKNITITIVIEQKKYQTITNSNGAFLIELDYAMSKEPTVEFLYLGESLKFWQEYPFFFKNLDSKFGVITDIDDTILVSHTANFIKRIGLLSIVPPTKRKTIAFTQKSISLLHSHDMNVFYVSKSESNLFNILSSFIIYNQLPKGKMFLTPYLNFHQLINKKKEKNFKLRNIEFILTQSRNKKFILYGDDTQYDMEIYESIASNFKSKIARIYIRQTRKKINTKKKALWDKLIETFPNSVYFNKHTNIDKELKILLDLIFKKENL